MNTKLIGAFGEQTAARFLRYEGYTIYSGNYKTNVGEIDIVAEKDNIICFVEVKTRKESSFSSPADAVDRKKQQNIKGTAAAYISRYDVKNEVRYDIVEIIVDEKYKVKNINHIINAF